LDHPIEVRSWLGRGSVFSVTVPLARKVEPAPRIGSFNPEPATLTGAQVLCVDNEESILLGMRSLLTRWGCQVWTARNREECEQLLKDGSQPQLVLVDYHLDSGGTRPELVAQVHGVGLDYLNKPVKPAALRALISRHLRLR